jgi:hypothetical protein
VDGVAGVNYPLLEYMGIEMGLAVYVLLEAGFQLFELRGIVRFRWG